MTRPVANLDVEPVAVADDRAGFGAMETPRGRLPLIALDVKSRISDLTARTVVRQTFRNALDTPLEATYIFPLPDRAAVAEFKMHVGNRTIDGVLKERGEARQQYDRAIQQGHRAAIAEEDRSGVFNLRVGNIPAKEEATVELTLTGPLAVADSEATFRFPLVVAPRYTPGIPLDGPSVGAGVTPDTDEVPDASRVTPPVLLPGFPNPVRLSLEVQIDPAGSASQRNDWIAGVRSSLHSTISEGASPWTVRLKPGERLNRDFILRFPVASRRIGTSLKASPASEGKPGSFALTLLPPSMDDLPATTPRDVVFVLDRSGSMGGWKMVAARRAVGRMIDTLLDHDRFGVLAFDNTIERPPHAEHDLVPGTNRGRWQTLEWLGRIEARGGTEMRSAITEAVRLLKPGKTQPDDAPREQVLVIVTDGQVTGEDAILRGLSKQTAGAPPRVFTVGIDRAVNAGFLRRLADFGHGSCELVESEDRLDEAMDRIHRLIGTPVLTNVRIRPAGFDWLDDSLSPARVPDLFADRPVTVYGRHASGDASIRLRVEATDANGRAWTEEVDARPDSSGMLTSMWGRAKVRDLEDEYAAGRGSGADKLMKRIVEVSLESQVLSRFTAYVAVDRSEVVNEGGRPQQIVQPVEMPDGWDMASSECAAFAAPPVPPAGGVSEARMLRCRSAPRGSFAADSVDSVLCESVSTPKVPGKRRASSDAGDDDRIVRLLHLIVSEAVEVGATEIRIEPLDDRIRVQHMINGKLVDQEAPPLEYFDALIAQIRKQAKLPAAKRGKPQQGQMNLVVDSSHVVLDVHLSPTIHGVSIRMELDVHSREPGKEEPPPERKRRRFWT